jgi:hypothetical protein
MAVTAVQREKAHSVAWLQQNELFLVVGINVRSMHVMSSDRLLRLNSMWQHKVYKVI